MFRTKVSASKWIKHHLSIISQESVTFVLVFFSIRPFSHSQYPSLYLGALMLRCEKGFNPIQRRRSLIKIDNLSRLWISSELRRRPSLWLNRLLWMKTGSVGRKHHFRARKIARSGVLMLNWIIAAFLLQCESTHGEWSMGVVSRLLINLVLYAHAKFRIMTLFGSHPV